MTEETPAKRGDAAWKEHRDEVSRRNDAAHRRALDDKRSQQATIAASARAEAEREATQLRDLNAQIDKQRAKGVR